MTAQEARELALKINTSEANSQYAKVITEIKKVASNGSYTLYLDLNMKPDVADKLKNDGYKVTISSSQYDGGGVNISW